MEQTVTRGEVIEEASPISSRPPANLEQQNLIRFDENVTETGTGTSSSSSLNRWPREETLALLKIRSEMDSNFRDSTLKSSLWDNVSRKLLELGYKRSAKKCKEKFENVQKYYKRTKETRHGRHENKAYKFFNELEALTTISSSLDVAPISVANPPLMSSSSFFSLTPQTQNLSFTVNPVTFSSHSSSTASGIGSDKDDIGVDLAGPSDRKRKRGNRHGISNKKMEFFQDLVKKVLQKQSEMQQRFLETLEKQEQEILEKQEAWRRQEISRLAQEHNFMSQERAKSASRDAAIISFLEKITGQTFKPAPPATISVKRVLSPLKQLQETQLQPIMAIPEQQILPPPLKQQEMRSSSSSRWPKAEILALINLRSGMEPKYQDNVPKGLLWEDISKSMQRMGYKRNAKRCKEKWENINKYYKKVKESNKKRSEDAKTCPYFHRLDLLYQNKVLGGSGSSSFGLVQHQEVVKPKDQTVQEVTPHVSAVNLDDGDEEERLEGREKLEDLVKKKQEEEDAMKVEVSKIEASDDYNLEEDEKSAAYEIEFQSSANRGGNGHKEPPFLTMVK